MRIPFLGGTKPAPRSGMLRPRFQSLSVLFAVLHLYRDLYKTGKGPMQEKRPPAPSQKSQPSCEQPNEMVGFWINLASRTIVRALDARLRPLGFAMSHLPVLRALAEGAALSQKDLARIARVEQPTMAEMLARMERDGLVQREPNPHDKRGSLVSLTRSARQRFPKARETLLAGEREATANFSADEKTMLLTLLRRVVTNVDGP